MTCNSQTALLTSCWTWQKVRNTKTPTSKSFTHARFWNLNLPSRSHFPCETVKVLHSYKVLHSNFQSALVSALCASHSTWFYTQDGAKKKWGDTFFFKKTELFWLEEMILGRRVLLVHHQPLAGERKNKFWSPDTHLLCSQQCKR